MINIITRTNNRPNGYKQNREQVIRCGMEMLAPFNEVNHIIITDDKESTKYIDVPYTFFDKKKEPTTDKPFGAIIWRPYNLYFNDVKDQLKEGWVMYIDDDDRLHNDRSLQDLYEILGQYNEDTIIFFQNEFKDGRKMPLDNWDGVPRLNYIGGSCLIFHTKWMDDVVWDEWSGGDFRMMDKLYKKVPNKVFINKPIVYVNQTGSGKRQDI
jgi:hypothetical protein